MATNNLTLSNTNPRRYASAMPSITRYDNVTIAKASTEEYWKRIEELDFAITAGDKEFAPAVKLVLREALALAHNARNYQTESYEAATNAVKQTYATLLDMPTTNPVAKQLQKRYKATHSDRFWNFMNPDAIAHTIIDYGIVASEGNITKHAYFVTKRMLDIILASLLLLAFSPLIIGAMIAIRLDSPGPVFFVQKRVGARRIRRAGMTVWQPVEFDFYKLRSMYANADETIHKQYIQNWLEGKAEQSEDDTARFKIVNDPRITRVGHFIRKTSIDELPQLFNVIKGDMSLVGPRPVPVYEVEGYREEDRERMASVPGITGLWQVKGRGQTTFEEQLEIDVDYIYQQSLWSDFMILLRTPMAVIKGEGAR